MGKRNFRTWIIVALVVTATGPLVVHPRMARAAYADSELRSQESGDDAKLRSIRAQEIAQLKIALGRREPANRRADLYLRLAEVYLEMYRAEFLLEGKVHEKKLEAGVRDQVIDRAHSKPYLSLGLRACQEILRLNIPYAKLDQVYFFLGFNYGELGDEANSIRYFEQLTQRFPNSPYAGEAYRELGDASTKTHDFRKAQNAYEHALRHATADTQPRLLHKLAWTYYRLKQYPRAVDTMKQAISTAQSSGEKFVSLREEALRDMALFMTESGRVDEAIAYFQGVAGDKNFYPKMLERLGKQYERAVEPNKATAVYESLLKTDPDSEAAFRVLVKLVDLDLRRQHYKEALGRIKNVQIPKTSEDETNVAAQNLRAMIRRTATENHEKFRKTGDKAALELAEAFYTAYVREFLAKDDPRGEIREIQMYLAEVKRDLGKSKEASELYRMVVDSRDKRYSKEAGALWTASLADAIRKSGAVAGAGEPSALEQEFIAAADHMQDAIGDTPEAREASLRAAQVLAGYPKSKDAQKDSVKRIKKIIDKWPRTAQAQTAARLWLQILSDRLPQGGSNDSGAVDDLRDAMSDLRKNDELMAYDRDAGKGKLGEALASYDTRLKIGNIARSEKDKDFSAAAKGYETFAREAQARDAAEKAYANAVANYLRAGDDDAVDRVTAGWIKRFAKSPRAVDSLRAAATGLLIAGKFEQAAKYFERAGTDGGDADSLETAARIQEGNGDPKRALELSVIYLEAFRASPHRWRVLASLARAQEASQQDSLAARSYRDCMAGAPAALAAECGARLADLYLRNKDAAQAKELYRKVGAMKDSPFVGYARYRMAELTEGGAHFEPLQLPDTQLKKAMNQRVEFLEPLSRAYNSVVDAGGPWAAAALDRLALFAWNFAGEVDRIAPPAGVEGKSLDQFRANLRGISDPLRKKAYDTWSQAYSKSVAADLLSPVLPAIADRLADARAAGAPARAQGARGKFRLAGLAADGGSDGRSTSLEKVRDRLTKNAQDAGAWVDYGNLLWGGSKPLLAKIAYERALALNPKHTFALNNSAVVALGGQGESEEDWLVVNEAAAGLREALKGDDFFLPAKINLALLYNYYRLFPKARPLWEQVLIKSNAADLNDGLAIALQGTGNPGLAEQSFKRADDAGGAGSRFARAFNDAARIAAAAPSADLGGKCVDRLDDVSSGVKGFEKDSVDRLKGTCNSWKNAK